MYLGHDGRQYHNRYDSFGYDSVKPDDTRRMKEMEMRRRELELNTMETEQRQQAISNQQHNTLGQQQIAAGDTQNFYDRQRLHDELVNRQYGIGQTGQERSSVPSGSFGVPAQRKETVIDPLVQDAGKLSRILNKYHRGQDPRDAEEAIGFINQHPGIRANNVAGIRLSHSDRNEDPMVTLLGDNGDPVKQFYLSSLSNLNNFAGQKTQVYDAGNKAPNDPGKLMEQLREAAVMNAQDTLSNESPKDQQTLMPEAIKRHYDQLMKQYGPRNPGYIDQPVQSPNKTSGFDLFGAPSTPAEEDPLAAARSAMGIGGQSMPAPPPPPATAQPKRGQGYGFGGNSMLPGNWRQYLPHP